MYLLSFKILKLEQNEFKHVNYESVVGRNKFCFVIDI